MLCDHMMCTVHVRTSLSAVDLARYFWLAKGTAFTRVHTRVRACEHGPPPALHSHTRAARVPTHTAEPAYSIATRCFRSGSGAGLPGRSKSPITNPRCFQHSRITPAPLHGLTGRAHPGFPWSLHSRGCPGSLPLTSLRGNPGWLFPLVTGLACTCSDARSAHTFSP